MNNRPIFRKVCPYFKDNCCASEYLSEISFSGSIVPLCETNDYPKCPIFIESSEREKEEK